MKWVVLLIVILLVALGLVLVGIYNRLIKGRNYYKNAFSQIDIQLRRRHDLIPNLVETAKGYMDHERETLEAVIKARNLAVEGLDQAKADPTDSLALDQLGEAERGLTGALSRLMAVTENYPDLKANETMMQLTDELITTENKVAFARQSYNDSVMDYNNLREVFPNQLIADYFSFEPAPLLEMDTVELTNPPNVQFK